ncbi:helix-turn-helix domain-containing protein [Vibrio aquimaris]|uniref:Helix-turn-helix domain protein n=1 Tax=Vibrio aquimaris TaxID=2587862 RepID=A0A5P9CT38_9VIBR|nr:helix-turn-helix transcriptional regulator [Vibrio aquimaris]QFT28822.1 Helix-turn-helix domain protein [Vibrio aquimaris]
MITIGERIKAARKAANLTVCDMLIPMGVSRSTYTAIERGKSDIKVTQLLKIADITNASFTYLATGEGYSSSQVSMINTLINNTMCGLSQIHTEVNKA